MASPLKKWLIFIRIAKVGLGGLRLIVHFCVAHPLQDIFVRDDGRAFACVDRSPATFPPV